MLADARSLSPAAQMQLLLLPSLEDLSQHLLGGTPPAAPSQVTTRSVAHRHPRLDLRPQLALWIVPPPPQKGGTIGGVGLSVKAALPAYKKKWKRGHKADLRRRMAAEGLPVELPASRPPRKDRHRSRPSRVKEAPLAVAAGAVTEGWAIDGWDWADEGRLVDGGQGAEGWAGWRLELVEAAMARREAQVQAEMAAKQLASGEPARPRQVVKRSKQAAAAAATAVLMAGKPGKSGKKALAAKAAATGAMA